MFKKRFFCLYYCFKSNLVSNPTKNETFIGQIFTEKNSLNSNSASVKILPFILIFRGRLELPPAKRKQRQAEPPKWNDRWNATLLFSSLYFLFTSNVAQICVTSKGLFFSSSYQRRFFFIFYKNHKWPLLSLLLCERASHSDGLRRLKGPGLSVFAWRLCTAPLFIFVSIYQPIHQLQSWLLFEPPRAGGEAPSLSKVRVFQMVPLKTGCSFLFLVQSSKPYVRVFYSALAALAVSPDRLTCAAFCLGAAPTVNV